MGTISDCPTCEYLLGLEAAASAAGSTARHFELWWQHATAYHPDELALNRRWAEVWQEASLESIKDQGRHREGHR